MKQEMKSEKPNAVTERSGVRLSPEGLFYRKVYILEGIRIIMGIILWIILILAVLFLLWYLIDRWDQRDHAKI